MFIFITILYSISLLYIFLYSLGQLHLTWFYIRAKRNKTNQVVSPLVDFPHVTVQLPVYNEKYVIEKLLDAMSALEYPSNKLEIQVIDDSTDETTTLIQNKITPLQKLGLNITHIHRNDRVGYKAGALANSLPLAKGEFIAIFDADFTPQSDFLLKTLPYFTNPEIGVVQTRWGHSNRTYSFLTKLQAFGLDAHFSIEQVGRSTAGSFINFNGTCGIWRKSCIEDAGGWSDDTLTEDLDLSYRAQLQGWKFKYLEEIETPGELPIIMPAIKSQQYRWNKGAAETARKIFGRVLKKRIPIRNKVHAFFHLFNSSIFVSLLIASLISVPMLFVKKNHPEVQWIFDLGIIFFIGFLSITYFYWVSVKYYYEQGALKKFISLYPSFIIVSMGLSLHNGIAVLEGLIGRKTPFIRTPKFNLQQNTTWITNAYIRMPITFTMILEGLLCAYFVFGIWIGISFRDVSLIFFHLLLALGFGSVFVFSVRPFFYAKN